MVKDLPANAGDIRDAGSTPGSGRSRGGHGDPLQCSRLENPLDGGAWWAMGHRVAQRRPWLKRLSTYSLHSVVLLSAVRQSELALRVQIPPCSRARHPTPVSLPGEPHGQGSLAGCRSWGHTEVNAPEAAEHTHMHTHIPCFGGVVYSHLGHHRALSRVSVLYNKFSLSILYIGSIVYMVDLSLPTQPTLPFPFGIHTFFLSICDLGHFLLIVKDRNTGKGNILVCGRI